MNLFRVVAGLALLLGSHSALAQNSFPEEPNWRTSLYLWTVALDGELGVGDNIADVDLSFSDILSELDFGAFLLTRRDWGQNVFVMDFNYAALDPDAQALPPDQGGSIDPELDLFIFDMFYGRKYGSPRDYWGWLVGGRYMVMDLGLTVTPPQGPGPGMPAQKISEDPDFLDAVVGLYKAAPLGDKWDMLVSGDFGTFGSDHSWQFQLIFQRKLNSGNYFTTGFRILDVDFDDVLSNGETFVTDASMTGLLIGYTWD